MAKMQTPKEFKVVEGMPAKVPVAAFSWELNQALTAKSDTERAAAAMFIQIHRGKQGKAFDMNMLTIDAEEKMVDEDSDSHSENDGIDPEIFANDIVRNIIMMQLAEEIKKLAPVKAKVTKTAKAVMKKAVVKPKAAAVKKAMKGKK